MEVLRMVTMMTKIVSINSIDTSKIHGKQINGLQLGHANQNYTIERRFLK